MSEIVQSKYADVDRDDAAMRLRRGEWTPADAKAWSNAHPKERPFESVPPQDRFDPMRKPEWTLAMAAAWIIWRTADAVREHWDAYLLECMKLRVKERRFGDERREVGWESLQRDPVSLSDIVRECARADPEGSKLKALDNIECLWNSLKEGQLEATGIFVGIIRRDVAPVAPRRVGIPRDEWIDLSPLRSYDGMPDSVGTALDIDPHYDVVRVRRERVCEIWEPATAISSAAAATRCRRWLIDQIKLSPSSRPMPKEKFWESASVEFEGLSKNQFDRQWDSAIEEQGATSWHRAGRPKKSN